MKNIFTIIIVFIISFKCSFIIANDEQFLISVIYKDQNLLIKNKIDKDGIGFSVKSIRLNGELLTICNNSEIIEIDFSKYGIENEDEIEILINYDSNSSLEFMYMNSKNDLNKLLNEKWLIKNEEL